MKFMREYMRMPRQDRRAVELSVGCLALGVALAVSGGDSVAALDVVEARTASVRTVQQPSVECDTLPQIRRINTRTQASLGVVTAATCVTPVYDISNGNVVGSVTKSFRFEMDCMDGGGVMHITSEPASAIVAVDAVVATSLDTFMNVPPPPACAA